MIRQRDRGSAAVEAALVFPPLLLIGLLLFAGVRTMTANGEVEAAARAGARAAATARSLGEARQRASAAARTMLDQDSTCRSVPKVGVDQFGAGAVVTVTVTCSVDTVFGGVLGMRPRVATGEASERVSEFRGGLD